MPTLPLVLAIVAIIGSVLVVGTTVRANKRHKENLKRYEKGEPLQGVDED